MVINPTITRDILIMSPIEGDTVHKGLMNTDEATANNTYLADSHDSHDDENRLYLQIIVYN